MFPIWGCVWGKCGGADPHDNDESLAFLTELPWGSILTWDSPASCGFPTGPHVPIWPPPGPISPNSSSFSCHAVVRSKLLRSTLEGQWMKKEHPCRNHLEISGKLILSTLWFPSLCTLQSALELSPTHLYQTIRLCLRNIWAATNRLLCEGLHARGRQANTQKVSGIFAAYLKSNETATDSNSISIMLAQDVLFFHFCRPFCASETRKAARMTLTLSGGSPAACRCATTFASSFASVWVKSSRQPTTREDGELPNW